MRLQDTIQEQVKAGLQEIYEVQLPSVELQPKRKDFEGDITVVILPMLRYVKGNTEKIGELLGEYLLKKVAVITDFEVIKGFLKLVIYDVYGLDFFNVIQGM